MNVPFDRYHTKQIQSWGGRRKGQVIHFHSAGDTQNAVQEKLFIRKCFFFQASYIVKEVRCIHLTNLYSLCEQVARSLTPSTKQKLNQLQLFFPKGKVISPQFQKEWNQKNVVFNLPKIGNLYYVNIDQLQYVNNHISASYIAHFFSLKMS